MESRGYFAQWKTCPLWSLSLGSRPYKIVWPSNFCCFYRSVWRKIFGCLIITNDFNLNHLDIQSPCGQGGTVFSSWAWAEVTILRLKYFSPKSNSLYHRKMHCSSVRIDILFRQGSHLERRGQCCNWWCWRIDTGHVLNTDLNSNRPTYIQIHLAPHFHRYYWLIHMPRVTKYKM